MSRSRDLAAYLASDDSSVMLTDESKQTESTVKPSASAEQWELLPSAASSSASLNSRLTSAISRQTTEIQRLQRERAHLQRDEHKNSWVEQKMSYEEELALAQRQFGTANDKQELQAMMKKHGATNNDLEMREDSKTMEHASPRIEEVDSDEELDSKTDEGAVRPRATPSNVTIEDDDEDVAPSTRRPSTNNKQDASRNNDSDDSDADDDEEWELNSKPAADSAEGKRQSALDEFYDAEADEHDEAFMSQTHGDNDADAADTALVDDLYTSSITSLLPSDAVLSCPACFTQLTHLSQQHARYKNQYRSIFPTNAVTVNKGHSIRPLAGTDDDKSAQYYATYCQCGCQVGAYEAKEDMHHFFNVLPSLQGQDIVR